MREGRARSVSRSSAREERRGKSPRLETDEVLVVYKKSDLELYVRERKNERYRALVDAGASLTAPMVDADRVHRASLEHVVAGLESRGLKARPVYRARLRAEDTKNRLVLTVGGDGTLLDAAKKLADAVLLGVNSDPDRSVGFLCAAHADDVGDVVESVLSGALAPTAVPRLALAIDDEPLATPVLNDVLVVHKNPAATARYRLTVGDTSEAQKSSGIWIAAPAGTTAGMLSAGGAVQALDDPRFQYRVRELYPLDARPPTLEGGLLDADAPLTVVSMMREGMIYIDGPHEKAPLSVGATLVVRGTGTPLPLVVTPRMRARRAALAGALGAR